MTTPGAAEEEAEPRRTPYVPFWYAIAVAFIAVVVLAGAGLIYTSYVQRQAERRAELVRIESDRRWCGLFAVIDPPAVQPTNDAERAIAAEIHRMRVRFGCP